jgi:uncharacterized protein YndB with AHSA1/START domain
METNAMNDSISHSVVADAPQERAFYAFAQQMTSWWPRQYTWSGENFGHIVLDPELGSRWYEVDAAGAEQPTWGTLMAWEPPSRLALTWMIGAKREPETDPSHASQVEVTFMEETPGKTRVSVTHSGFKHHGEAWESYRDGMSGAEGWPRILESFAEYAGQQMKYGVAA